MLRVGTVFLSRSVGYDEGRFALCNGSVVSVF